MIRSVLTSLQSRTARRPRWIVKACMNTSGEIEAIGRMGREGGRYGSRRSPSVAGAPSSERHECVRVHQDNENEPHATKTPKTTQDQTRSVHPIRIRPRIPRMEQTCYQDDEAKR